MRMILHSQGESSSTAGSRITNLLKGKRIVTGENTESGSEILTLFADSDNHFIWSGEV